jgi:hypothetical protein
VLAWASRRKKKKKTKKQKTLGAHQDRFEHRSELEHVCFYFT